MNLRQPVRFDGRTLVVAAFALIVVASLAVAIIRWSDAQVARQNRPPTFTTTYDDQACQDSVAHFESSWMDDHQGAMPDDLAMRQFMQGEPECQP